MKIKIIHPADELKHVVRYFWVLELNMNPDETTEIRTFVDDSSGFVFHHNHGRSAIIKDGGSIPTGIIYGQSRQPSLATAVSSFGAVGVLFHPQAIKSLFEIDAHYLTDRVYSLDEFDKQSDLRDAIMHSVDSNEKIRVLSDFLLKKAREVNSPDPLVGGALQLMSESRVSQVKDLVSYFNVSERQLERRFLASVGVSPRHYLQTMRFRTVVQFIRNNRFGRLSEVAHELDFADQPHFNRVIRKFSGLNPKRFQYYRKDELVNLLLR